LAGQGGDPALRDAVPAEDLEHGSDVTVDHRGSHVLAPPDRRVDRIVPP
jgi:hypothetical protein